MLQRVGLLLLAMLLCGLVFGQKQSAVHDASREFFLEYTNPAYFISSDSVLQQKNADKYYSLYSHIYAREKKAGISKQDVQVADSLALYIRKRYVAEKYLERLAEEMTVSQDEILAYYKLHQANYATEGVCTYYQVFVMQEDAETIKTAKAKVLELDAMPDSIMPFKGEKNTTFSISLEKNIKLMASYPTTFAVEKAPVRSFTELVQIPGFNFRTIYYVTDRTNVVVKPFEEVQENCRQRLKNEKLQSAMDNLYSEAKQKFPATTY